MIINVPNSFIPERKYITDCIFREFLGLDFEFKIHNDNDKYKIIIPGGGKLIIKDDFFSRFSESEGYLSKSNIPDSVQYFNNSFPAFADTPVLFGNTEIIKEGGTIIIGADIFSSAFFMLTRWEEYVIQDRDIHNRFPGSSSLAFKNNFLDRPVVNEYADIILELLLRAGLRGERRKREYKIVPTHDIDQLFYWDRKNRKNLLKNLTGDLFKRKNSELAFWRIKSYCESYSDYTKDPNYSFDFLMSLAENSRVKANFYFMAGGESPYDPDTYVDTIAFKNIIHKIKQRDHVIGIHPSYKSYNEPAIIRNEIKRLEESVRIPIKSGRHHYLRFDVPKTWQIWDACRLETSSSMYYSGYPGFRCGTCYEFPVFDIIQRKLLALREMPLLIMDTCLINYDPDEVVATIRGIRSHVKKHNGSFVFVWHNSNVFREPLNSFKPIFEKEFYE